MYNQPQFSTTPTYRATPLCPACITTIDSNIMTIIKTNVIIPATIFNLLENRPGFDPVPVEEQLETITQTKSVHNIEKRGSEYFVFYILRVLH